MPNAAKPATSRSMPNGGKTAHAEALARLTKNQRRDPVCRACHTMAPTTSDARLSGVQCESCHGNGRYYEPAHIMRDKKLAGLMGLKPVTEATCRRCHRADAPSLEPFDFARKLELVRHKKPQGTEPQSARPTARPEGRDG